MRKLLILASGTLTFGLGAGYAWAAMTASAPRLPRATKGGFMALPASPEERPGALDQEWSQLADDRPAAPVTADQSVTYAGCDEVRAAGKAPLNSGDPGYSEAMDGDHDGVACEPIRTH